MTGRRREHETRAGKRSTSYASAGFHGSVMAEPPIAGSTGPTAWRTRLTQQAIPSRHDEFDLLLHVSLSPAFPPEYDVAGLVAVTYRLRRRPDGSSFVYVTAIDPAAALRIGARLGLDEAESLAMVDSHERIHIWLQLAGVPEEVEEDRMRIIDATWLSLRHPRAADVVRSGEFGLVTEVEEDYWERLVDEGS